MPLDRPSPSLHLPPARPSAPPSAHRAPPPSQTRLRPGTRAQHAFPPSDPFAPPRPLSDFDESPFAVREYVVALVRRDAGDLDALVRVPGGGRARAACEGEEEEEGEDEVRVEEQVFVLEHVRCALAPPLFSAFDAARAHGPNVADETKRREMVQAPHARPARVARGAAGGVHARNVPLDDDLSVVALCLRRLVTSPPFPS